MSAPKRYNWAAALSAFKVSGLPVQRFHREHADEFTVNGWVPSCQTMRNHLAGGQQSVTTPVPQTVTGSNLSVVELPVPAAHRPAMPRRLSGERRLEKTQFRIKLPNGTSLEFSTSRPEALAIELVARGAVQ